MWYNHLSWALFLIGLGHLGLLAIRKAELPENHALKTWGGTILSWGLFGGGIAQWGITAFYLKDIFFGERGVVFSPYYAFENSWLPALITLFYGVTMAIGGFSAIGQVGRKLPAATLVGIGTGGLIGASVFHTTSGVGLATMPAVGIGVIFAIVMYGVAYIFTAPFEGLLKNGGEYCAYSPVMVITGAIMTILGAISGVGLVVL